LSTGVRTLEREAGAGAGGGFLDELRRPYKAGQGAWSRRIGWWVAFLFLLWGCFDLWQWLQSFEVLRKPLFPEAMPRLPLGGAALGLSLVVVTVVGAAGWGWIEWYLKRPWLADLLIETEAEMKKVSWPAGEEAWAATRVVAVAVLLFTVVLTIFDLGIRWVLQLLFRLGT